MSAYFNGAMEHLANMLSNIIHKTLETLPGISQYILSTHTLLSSNKLSSVIENSTALRPEAVVHTGEWFGRQPSLTSRNHLPPSLSGEHLRENWLAEGGGERAGGRAI